MNKNDSIIEALSPHPSEEAIVETLKQIASTKKRRSEEIEGAVPCTKCGKRCTEIKNVQERAGDEGTSMYTECYNCGHIVRKV